MQEGIESAGKFVVSGCDTLELLEAIEESLDEVSCLVTMPVDFALGIAIASRRDDRVGAGGLDDLDQSVAIVTFVSDDSSGRDCLNQGSPLRDIRPPDRPSGSGEPGCPAHRHKHEPWWSARPASDQSLDRYRFFGCARRMLVGTNNRGINE